MGQVVCISGEAGIGKSALVEALRAQVRAEGMLRMAFRCSPYHTTSPLYPVITHIEHLLQCAPDDPPATKVAKLEAGLQPYNLPLAEVVPRFARLLSVPLPAERYAALTLTPQQSEALSRGKGFLAPVLESQRDLVVASFENEEAFASSERLGFETTSLLCSRIRLEGQLLGLIVLGDHERGHFDLNALNLVQGIARQAAQAIVNARHRDEQQARSRHSRQFVRF